MASSWEQLSQGVRLPYSPDLVVPELHEIALDVPQPAPVGDVETAVAQAVKDRFASVELQGKTVAVGAGSRGLTGRVETLRGAIEGLRELGALPFVVPAMGSHAGGTAEGQKKLLATLGVTEESIGCDIRSSMKTLEVVRTAAGTPVYLDEHAAGAHYILPVNRVKPHTCFKGPIESGCTKMAVVGFGKQPGAALIHSCGPEQMAVRLLDGISALRSTGRLLGGVATVESCAGAVVRVQALSSDEVGGDAERDLTAYARSLVPQLPFTNIDVLIVERGGKDISGTSIDPNVSGRFWVHGLSDFPDPPATIVLLSVTEAVETCWVSVSPTLFLLRLQTLLTGKRRISTVLLQVHRVCAAASFPWFCPMRSRVSKPHFPCAAKPYMKKSVWCEFAQRYILKRVG